MDYLNSPINKDEQLSKIIQDTEEIIKNFKEISELLAARATEKNETMYKLGKKVIHERGEVFNPSSNLGISQVRFL